MHAARLLPLVLGISTLAVLNRATRAAEPAQPPAAVSGKPSNGPEGVSKIPLKPYRLYAILDPDRDKMVAFALKVPSDWRAEQSFYRKWDGAIGLPQVFVTLRSPDRRSQIVYFPSSQYVSSEGPTTESLRAQKRSLGLPVEPAPNELAPLSPTAYLRQVFIPLLSRNGIRLENLGNEQTAPEKRSENGQIEQRGSIDGTLPDGARARIEVRLTKASRQLGTDTWHAWSALPSITQAAGDIEAIHAHTRVAQDSVVVNPAWMKLEQEAQARGAAANREASRQQHEETMAGIRANTAAMTRAHEQRMNDIRAFGQANTARFNERMAAGEREQRVRVDTIRGESRYADPTTGERVRVEDGFNHVYRSQRNPDLFYGSQAPIDSSTLDWQELQKVQLEDY